MRPAFATSGWSPDGETGWPAAKFSRPSPARSMAKVSAPASTTWAYWPTMAPSLRTQGATSAARPFSPTLMVPWLTTEAPATGDGVAKSKRPAMKASLAMSAVVANRPLTSTTAFGPKATPLGLTSQTWPTAWIDP